MSHSNKYFATNSLAMGRQRSTMRLSDEWGNECDQIATILKERGKPLRSKEIATITMLSQNSVRKRLKDLIESGRVRERTDGPDARITYYEHTDHNHFWMGDWVPVLRAINEADGPVSTDTLIEETDFYRKKVLDELRHLIDDGAIEKIEQRGQDGCFIYYEIK